MPSSRASGVSPFWYSTGALIGLVAFDHRVAALNVEIQRRAVLRSVSVSDSARICVSVGGSLLEAVAWSSSEPLMSRTESEHLKSVLRSFDILLLLSAAPVPFVKRERMPPALRKRIRVCHVMPDSAR